MVIFELNAGGLFYIQGTKEQPLPPIVPFAPASNFRSPPTSPRRDPS
jgi:hypothetical protein